MDTNAQTLTASIEHFSSHATFDRVKLRPEKANLKVGKSVSSACRPTKATQAWHHHNVLNIGFPQAISFMENELKD
ncbi:MAG: hypothetical protein H7Y86_03755 [Rhizobacter sp.]|nr:hypothetical protein [Ferruginibacter sp.]